MKTRRERADVTSQLHIVFNPGAAVISTAAHIYESFAHCGLVRAELVNSPTCEYLTCATLTLNAWTFDNDKQVVVARWFARQTYVKEIKPQWWVSIYNSNDKNDSPHSYPVYEEDIWRGIEINKLQTADLEGVQAPRDLVRWMIEGPSRKMLALNAGCWAIEHGLAEHELPGYQQHALDHIYPQNGPHERCVEGEAGE